MFARHDAYANDKTNKKTGVDKITEKPKKLRKFQKKVENFWNRIQRDPRSLP